MEETTFEAGVRKSCCGLGYAALSPPVLGVTYETLQSALFVPTIVSKAGAALLELVEPEEVYVSSWMRDIMVSTQGKVSDSKELFKEMKNALVGSSANPMATSFEIKFDASKGGEASFVGEKCVLEELLGVADAANKDAADRKRKEDSRMEDNKSNVDEKEEESKKEDVEEGGERGRGGRSSKRARTNK